MKVALKDGTVLEVRLTEESWGDTYNVLAPIDESVLSEDNLSDVYIDGEHKGRMVLDFFRPDGLQFYIRELSAEEQKIYSIQDKVDEVVQEPYMTSISASKDNITVPANGRANVQIDLPTIPEGFVFGAYREVSLGGDDSGFENCAIQFFGSAGQGTKANLGIKNFADFDVVVRANVTVLFLRDWSM